MKSFFNLENSSIRSNGFQPITTYDQNNAHLGTSTENDVDDEMDEDDDADSSHSRAFSVNSSRWMLNISSHVAELRYFRTFLYI